MPKKIIEKNQNPSALRASPLDKGDTNELSYDTKTLITVITLVTVYPVGLILMFIWMKWNKLLKFLVAFPVILILLVPICLFFGLIIGGLSLIGRPETKDTFETVKNTIRQEMMISPTVVVSPTKMMVRPTSGVIKK
jgi:hypothetical protein